MRAQDWDALKASGLLERYALIKPVDVDSTAQLGGTYVVNGARLLYEWRDPGLNAHAPLAEVLAACRGSEQA